MFVSVPEILGKDFAEHLFIDRRCHRELHAYIAAPLADLADLRGHHQPALGGRALLAKDPSPAVDDVADIRACSLPAGDLVGKASQDAFEERVIGRSRGVDIESLSLGESEELIVDLARLPRRVRMHGEVTAPVGPEVHPLRPAEGPCGNKKVGSTTAEKILPSRFRRPVGFQEQGAGLGQCRQQGGIPDASVFLCRKKHPRVAGMCGEGQHPTSEGGDGSIVSECSEITEECLGTGEGVAFRGIHPADLIERGQSRCLQGEQDLAEIDPVNFGEFPRNAPLVLALGPESETGAWRCSPGASRPLVSRGPTDLPDQEGVDAAAGIETRHPCQSAIDHPRDPVDREGGLRDVRRDDHLAAPSGRDRRILFRGGKFSVEGQDRDLGGKSDPERRDGPGDLVGAGHEDQQVPAGFPEHRLGRLRGEVPRFFVSGFAVEVGDLDGMGPAGGTQDRAGGEVLLQGGGVERRRHHHDLQVGSSCFLKDECLCQRDIAVEVALVKLVKDKGGHPV